MHRRAPKGLLTSNLALVNPQVALRNDTHNRAVASRHFDFAIQQEGSSDASARSGGLSLCRDRPHFPFPITTLPNT